MKFDPKSVAQFAEKYWYTKSGLAVALVVTAFSVGTILANARAPWPAYVVALATSWFGVYGLWRLSHRVPRTKKNRLGFVISIQCEDDEKHHRVREDFVIPLRRLLRSSKLGKTFHFIELPQHIAAKINDTADAEELRTKTRALFMVHGRVRERIIDGEEYHIIELDGVVAHKPVAKNIQKSFAVEFSELFPRRINIAKENDFLAFEFTSEWAGVVAEYIIGIAAYISGALDHAEELYQSALIRLEGKDSRFPIYAKLVERIPLRISELYVARAVNAHRAWIDTRNERYIDELEHHLEKVAIEHRRDPNVLFLNSLHVFAKNRDTTKAIAYLKRIKEAAKGSASSSIVGTWNYNMAFLYAYKGNLSTAIRHYRKAAMAVVEPDIINQIESFLCWILEQEPKKYQLSYCLGFFNWKTKGDIVQAEKDFNRFLAARRENEFEKEKKLAEKWIGEMHSGPSSRRHSQSDDEMPALGLAGRRAGSGPSGSERP